MFPLPSSSFSPQTRMVGREGSDKLAHIAEWNQTAFWIFSHTSYKPAHFSTFFSHSFQGEACCVSFRSVMLCNWPCGTLNYLPVCAAKDSVQPFQFHKQWKYRLTTELEFLCFAALGWPASGWFVFSTAVCEGLAAISLGKRICLIDQTRTK